MDVRTQSDTTILHFDICFDNDSKQQENTGSAGEINFKEKEHKSKTGQQQVLSPLHHEEPRPSRSSLLVLAVRHSAPEREALQGWRLTD